MTSVTWVCFDCRASSRRDAWAKVPPRCAECQEPKRCLGKKVPLPKKRATKDWEALRELYFQERRKFGEYLAVRRTRLMHRLERQISELEGRPPAKGREKELRGLRVSLDNVRAWSLDNAFGVWHLRRPNYEEHVAARKATWIARLERQLRKSESEMGASPWNRERRHVLKRLEEVRRWSAEAPFDLGLR